MDTHLQESGGLRRTAPVQSPVPVGPRLSLSQRVLVGMFLALMALTYVVQLLPAAARGTQAAPAPSSPNDR